MSGGDALNVDQIMESEVEEWQHAVTSGTAPVLPPSLREAIERRIGMVIDDQRKSTNRDGRRPV